MNQVQFLEPNFRCQVSAEYNADSKKYWRLCFAEDVDNAQAILEQQGLIVHSIQPYDFSEWLAKAEAETKKVINSFQAGEKPTFKPLWRELKEHLIDLFHGKCAYCEVNFRNIGFGDVDMFRPKAKIAGVKDHPGYYWMAYDPQNYLPSCQVCNQMQKRSFFPISGKRAFSPGDSLKDEMPLLLNPYLDIYSKHLHILPSVHNEKPGYAIGSSDRGKKTIEILSLNRPALVENRRQEQEVFRIEIKQAYMKMLVEENPEAVTSLVSQIHSNERQFTTALSNEMEDFYTKIGLPSPVTK